MNIAVLLKTEICNCILSLNKAGIENLNIVDNVYPKDDDIETYYKNDLSPSVSIVTEDDLRVKNIVLDLRRYFDGKRIDLSVYKLDISRYSQFSLSVFNTVRLIPFGNTRTYKWVSTHIKHTMAYRAVGNALAKNRIPIFIPCHRVIKENGTLGGFCGSSAGSQIELKKRLLSLERQL